MSGVLLWIFQTIEIVGFFVVLIWAVREVKLAMGYLDEVSEGLKTERKERIADVLELKRQIQEINKALRAINRALGTKKAHGPNEAERRRHYRIKDYGDGK